MATICRRPRIVCGWPDMATDGFGFPALKASTRRGDLVSKVAKWLRAEADEYRQGAERPLGGYAVLMTVFGGLAAMAGGVAALRGTRSSRISPYDLVVMTAGTHKLT